MEKLIRIFHYLSLIKYPIMLIGLYYCYRPILFDDSSFFQDINLGLIFIGLGIGLDSLKDYGKLNWLDKKVLHKPKIAKYYFIIFGLIILGLICIGIKNYLSTDDSKLKELSIGFIVVGIGLIGLLKSGIEATKNYMNRERIKTTANRVDGREQ
ncbi:MAG: hypothetical protein AAF149_15000 [Bacteroidota bacterium]